MYDISSVKEARGCFTCAPGSTDRNQVSPVLCDGLDGQLVLAQRSLLHDGDGCHGSCLRALNDATDSAHGRGCHGGDRLHFHCGGAEPHGWEPRTSPRAAADAAAGFAANDANSPLIS